jgi:toxin ParE1/3/4
MDLEEIGDYIALDNPRRAVSFIREIRQHCEKIADGPHHYAARPDLGDTIRICTLGNYLIVFEPFDDGALILRVLHGARNVPGVLGTTDPIAYSRRMALWAPVGSYRRLSPL